MNLDGLSSVAANYAGYLEGERVDQLFAEFDIRFAAGHWCAGEFFDRFCPIGYNSDNPDFRDGIIPQIERVSKAGIVGIEFHDKVFIDDQDSRDDRVIDEVRAALNRHGVTPTNMNFNTWTDPRFKYGGVTHPDPGIRKLCRDQINLGIDIGAEIGCVSCGLWPGSDGWDYHFEVDYGQRLRWFIDACTEFAEHCDHLGLAFGTEPKQKEPREGNMIINTVAKAACVCIEVNRTLGKPVMGVAIDYGHEQMVGNTPAESLYLLKTLGIPIANFHINGAKYNSNDEDRIAGTDDVWRLVEFCYAAIDTGYPGWFGEDQFTYRTEQVESMRLSREFFANCMKKALLIYAQRNELQRRQATGDAVQTINLVKKIIYNG
ncbi:MAG: TIM barrel protein [Methanoregulaceae archaeon]|nr:TIM barrel protein [Methanoregulaceae archaeon]